MIKFSAYCRVCLLLGLLCALSSCEKDDDKSDKAVNQWIDATMRSWYLWYSDIPDKKQRILMLSRKHSFVLFCQKKMGRIIRRYLAGIITILR